MIYSERIKDDSRFLVSLLISIVLNLMLFLIPSCNKTFKGQELKYETIKTGLISITDTNTIDYKKEVTSDKGLMNQSAEQYIKTQEKVETVTSETAKVKVGTATTNSKTNEKKTLSNLTGPTRVDNGIEGVVLTTKTSKSLREKQEGTYTETSKGNVGILGSKNSNLKGIELGSGSLKDGAKSIQTGNYDKTTVGIDKNNSSSQSDNIGKVLVDAKGINNSIPKNISANVMDVSGGRVVWRKYTTPDYPDEAQKNGQEGDIEVEFLIKNGKTNYLGIVGKSGYSLIDKSVDKAAKNWILLIEKNGVSVDGKVKVKVTYVLK